MPRVDHTIRVTTTTTTWLLPITSHESHPGSLHVALAAALDGPDRLRALGAHQTTSWLPRAPALKVHVDDASFRIDRPAPCPHHPPPRGRCHERPSTVHDRLHESFCGCWCSGILRFHQRPPTPVPLEYATPAIRLLERLFARTWVREPWVWFERFEQRADSTDPQALALWAELVDVHTTGSTAVHEADRNDAIVHVVGPV
jgi:hypothetical protein